VPQAEGHESSLATLGGWLGDRRDAIASQVIVRDVAGQTEVSIDHRFSCDLEPHAGWHVRTRPTLLPRAHFASYAGAKIKGAAHDRGRAIYCHDPLSNEVTAALSYHLDGRAHFPLLVTAFGFRIDTAGSAFMRERTLAAALVIKHHLHAIAAAVGRGGHVDIDLNKRDDQLDLAKELGFRKARKVRDFRPSGHHLRQAAPG